MFFSLALPILNVGENFITSLFLPFPAGFFPFNCLKLNLPLLLLEDEDPVVVDVLVPFVEFLFSFFEKLVEEDTATPLFVLVVSDLVVEVEPCASFLLLFPEIVLLGGLFWPLFFFFFLLFG